MAKNIFEELSAMMLKEDETDWNFQAGSDFLSTALPQSARDFLANIRHRMRGLSAYDIFAAHYQSAIGSKSDTELKSRCSLTVKIGSSTVQIQIAKIAAAGNDSPETYHAKFLAE